MFENSILASGMPIDEDKDQKQGRPVKGKNFSKVMPTPIEKPYIASVSHEILQMIGLGEHERLNQAELAEYLCGNKLFDGSIPLSHCYAGHQFGAFSGQLGDGRAISLGDVK